METVVLIPARAGSKRVPGKNTRKAGGLPLIVHSIVLGVRLNLPVFVSTDDPEAGALAEEYGARFIERPAKFAQDDSTDFDVVHHFLNHGAWVDRPKFIIYLRPTTPIRTVNLVERAIRGFQGIADIKNPPTSMRSVHEMSESAFKCVTMIGNLIVPLGIPGGEDFNQNNHVYQKTYRPNGYIDIVRPDLVEGRDLWGPRIMGFETPPVIEVDTEFDFRLLENEFFR